MEEALSLKEKFYERYFSLDNDTILKINQFDSGPLNNVITGLNDEAFGISLVDEGNPIVYILFYINGKSKLEGHSIEVSIDEPDRDGLVFIFAQYLSQVYPLLDTIDVFNTFQTNTRTMLEKLGYLTYCPTEIQVEEGSKFTIIAKGVLGVFKIPFIDKLYFLRNLFTQYAANSLFEEEDFVYLMLNSKSNLIKIGQSQKPHFREKTLQGEEPEINVIACWRAPKKVEKELHNIYSNKRTRGEWFKLSLKDLKDIKEFMAQYE